MLRSVLAGTTALAIAGATLAYAAQPGPRHDRMNHWRPSAADITAFGNARIAALHAGLQLTPDQEKNWPAVESALRDLAKQRADRVAARSSADRPKDPIERLARRATAMSERGAALKKVANAVEPLYQTLDEGQKHRFMILARLGHHRFAQWRHGDRDGWRHHHRGGPEQGPQPQ
ncbi:MAG TPA: Spy/CpxP family protein refolding chaperone [Pseudolabrys sp.]|nr:Spy/CpxP family protein refolding chaperone [Pseudolabrys sp.]